jgi:hypothetical protein
LGRKIISFSSAEERQARPLVVGCSTETGSDAGNLSVSLTTQNFGALIDERYPFRVIRLPFNVLMATRPSAVFPTTGEG